MAILSQTFIRSCGLHSCTFWSRTGPILVDDVKCNPSIHRRLLDCPHPGLQLHNCAHSEDAGISCPTCMLLLLTKTLAFSFCASWILPHMHAVQTSDSSVQASSSTIVVGGVLGFIIVLLLVLLIISVVALVCVLRPRLKNSERYVHLAWVLWLYS